MEQMSLEEYIRILVSAFRRNYDKMSKDEISAAQLNMTFARPCQIDFFSFEGREQFMVVTLDATRPDEIRIQEHIITEDKVSFVKSKLEAFSRGKEVAMDIKHTGRTRPASWHRLEENASVYFFYDIQELHPDPAKYGEEVFSHVEEEAHQRLERQKRIAEYGTIEEQIRAIRQDVKRLDNSGLKTRVLESAKKIDEAISTVKTIEMHEQRLIQMEQEIGGVRKMIGTTKEFQDFRVLATDVDDLKKSHVHKDLFESEIRRLDQRIESYKEIRFWSKRAIVDVALAIAAASSTIVAALLAAHII
ncbi:MAG TPA: hypothetical protein VMW36_06735 [Patescibacteria group bacterium]|nr:hypothetical protein [Patescibacteria group bacterium]